MFVSIVLILAETAVAATATTTTTTKPSAPLLPGSSGISRVHVFPLLRFWASGHRLWARQGLNEGLCLKASRCHRMMNGFLPTCRGLKLKRQAASSESTSQVVQTRLPKASHLAVSCQTHANQLFIRAIRAESSKRLQGARVLPGCRQK